MIPSQRIHADTLFEFQDLTLFLWHHIRNELFIFSPTTVTAPKTGKLPVTFCPTHILGIME